MMSSTRLLSIFFLAANVSAQSAAPLSSYTCPAPSIYGGLGFCGPTQ